MTQRPLDAILALGERMCQALESDDVDAFCTLVAERDQLIRSLSDGDRPSDVTRAVQAITEQHARIQSAMERADSEIGGKIGAFSRFRSARTAYRQKPAHKPQRLNKHLRG